MTFKEYRALMSDFNDNFRYSKLKRVVKKLDTEGIKAYRNEVLSVFSLKKLPSRNGEQLIAAAIPKSFNDYNKKQNNKEYYVANAIIFIEYMEWLLPSLEIALGKYKPQKKDLLVYNYNHLLRNLMFDSIFLLQNYRETILKQSHVYGVGKNPFRTTFHLFQTMKQVIYGQGSFHSFIDREVDVANAILRMTIELRIRHGLGVLGVIRKEDSAILPLPLERLLTCLKENEANITLPVSVNSLIRIYGATNIFLHSGIRHYSWQAIKAMEFLQEFFLGVKGSTSIHSGIAMKPATLMKIHKCLKKTISEKNKRKFDLFILGKVDAIVK